MNGSVIREFFILLLRYPYHFLDTHRIKLMMLSLEIGGIDKFFCKQAVTPLCQQNNISLNYFALLVIGLLVEMLVKSLIDELYAPGKITGFVVYYFLSRKTVHNLGTKIGRYIAKPYRQFTYRYVIVTFMRHLAKAKLKSFHNLHLPCYVD